VGQTDVVAGPPDSHVTILLSTFDGGSWLPELLASLRAQSHGDWSLLVRDDGSTDDTVELLLAAAGEDSRIELLDDDLGNLGPAASFMELLRQVRSGMFAFCDQDDVWLPHKLDASLETLDSDRVAAVFTDAVVVTADGDVISSSALSDRGLRGEVPFGHLLINNAAIGATMLGTAALARAAVDLADDRPVLMHDWWVALVAAHQGSLGALSTPTIRWRRHEATVTGGRPIGIRGRAARRREYLAWSIDAARRLQAGPAPTSDSAKRAVEALAGIDPRTASVRDLLRAWRHGGVRAWPLRGEASLLFSLRIGQMDH
jgi:rhamnosyltransferase